MDLVINTGRREHEDRTHEMKMKEKLALQQSYSDRLKNTSIKIVSVSGLQKHVEKIKETPEKVS